MGKTPELWLVTIEFLISRICILASYNCVCDILWK
uniref:Uncharacterized protein n=1 Tax=Anguilla anguilla TaxID=7936 RepID=A0A0E9RKX0_ANGAN